MANTNRPVGFSPVSSNPRAVHVRLSSSITVVKGDALFMGSDGYANATQAAGTCIGFAASPPMDGTTNLPITTSSATAGTDYILVYPAVDYEFEGQMLLGAVTDVYTSLTTACFDLVTTSGAGYITASSSTYDTAKITGVAAEDNTGKRSQPGSYQKVYFRVYNPCGIAQTLIKDPMI